MRLHEVDDSRPDRLPGEPRVQGGHTCSPRWPKRSTSASVLLIPEVDWPLPVPEVHRTIWVPKIARPCGVSEVAGTTGVPEVRGRLPVAEVNRSFRVSEVGWPSFVTRPDRPSLRRGVCFAVTRLG